MPADPPSPSHHDRLVRSHHVLVIGAGPTAMFAAKTLTEAGAQVTVAEKSDRVGGLAASRHINGNYYEGGVHHLHAFDAYVYEEVSRLMGDRLLPVEKSALIRYGDGFCRYPLQFADILKAMQPLTLVRCCAGLTAQQLVNRIRPREPEDGEQALIQLYGEPLYRLFFEEFTHRYWGIPPKELSPVFIKKKMPRLSAFDPIRKALGKLRLRERRNLGVESALAKETLYYTPTGAHEIYETLLRYVGERGAEVRLGAPLRRLEAVGGRVVAAHVGEGAEARTDGLRFVISTIPLPDLIRAFGDVAPREIGRAADALFYKPQAVLGLLVRKERVLDVLYVYFRDRVFHRVGEPKLSGLKVSPAGHTILVVELTEHVEPGDPERHATIFQEVCRDLAKDDLISGPGDVVEHHFLHHRHAYPIYLRGFDRNLELIFGFLDGFENLVSTGRQGGFSYPNMHQAMRKGHEAALQAIDYCARGYGSA